MIGHIYRESIANEKRIECPVCQRTYTGYYTCNHKVDDSSICPLCKDEFEVGWVVTHEEKVIEICDYCHDTLEV